MIEQIIVNLAVNARDAMPEGGSLHISGRAQRVHGADGLDLPPGEYVHLSIADTGEGMDAATLERATEPFFTTKGVGKGTGLGLSMVHGIVQQCGGAMTLHSSRPGGTVVDIWLPLAHASNATAEASATTAPVDESLEAAMAAPSPSATSVLVVDDDPLVLSTTVEMLCFEGYDAVGASSARQALQVLGESPSVSILVTDHAMPGMTGMELATQVAASYPEIHVVLASGYAELPEQTPSVHARLQKPYGRADLLAALRAP
jgi:CheY-like chemotaxis protein